MKWLKSIALASHPQARTPVWSSGKNITELDNWQNDSFGTSAIQNSHLVHVWVRLYRSFEAMLN